MEHSPFRRGGEEGIKVCTANLSCLTTARVCVQHPSAHHSPIKRFTESFYLSARAPSVFESHYFTIKKEHHLVLFFYGGEEGIRTLAPGIPDLTV